MSVGNGHDGKVEMMRGKRRFATLLVGVVAVASMTATSATAAGYSPVGRSRTGWVERYSQWLFGEADSPLLTGACGDVVDGVFFLVPPSKPNRSQSIPCVVPAGVPIVLSHALVTCGELDAPTFGGQRRCARVNFLPLRSSVSVDGSRVRPARIATDVFPLQSERDSVWDGAGEGTGPVLSASVGLLTFVRPLERGDHFIEAFVDYGPDAGGFFRAIYRIEVRGLG